MDSKRRLEDKKFDVINCPYRFFFGGKPVLLLDKICVEKCVKEKCEYHEKGDKDEMSGLR